MTLISDLFSLSGKTALVTGGSKGIGRMIAAGFIEAGCERVYISARDAKECEAAAAALGSKCVALPQDLSTVTGCRALSRTLKGLENQLDILVNNAGADWIDEFLDFPEGGWDSVMDINLKAPFFLIQSLHPMLKAAAKPGRPAKVINIVSIDALKLNPVDAYSYYASKSALMFISRRLASQLIGDGIVVSAIAPGSFPTDLNAPARDDPQAVAMRNPSGRIGTPADMQGAAIYLASRAGNWVVGDTIVVDGGKALANTSG